MMVASVILRIIHAAGDRLAPTTLRTH